MLLKNHLKVIKRLRTGKTYRNDEKLIYDPNKSIVQLSEGGQFIRKFFSFKDAEHTLKLELNKSISWTNISAVCRKCIYRQTAYGYRWMYESDYLREKDNESV